MGTSAWNLVRTPAAQCSRHRSPDHQPSPRQDLSTHPCCPSNPRTVLRPAGPWISEIQNSKISLTEPREKAEPGPVLDPSSLWLILLSSR